MDCNENCWVMTGKWHDDLWWARVRNKTCGIPIQVAFDYDWILKREDNGIKDTIGWLHTHPGMEAARVQEITEP